MIAYSNDAQEPMSLPTQSVSLEDSDAMSMFTLDDDAPSMFMLHDGLDSIGTAAADDDDHEIPCDYSWAMSMSNDSGAGEEIMANVQFTHRH